MLQGAQLAGERGVDVEDAPRTLLDGVTSFLLQQRASLRAETQTSLAGRIGSLVPGV